MFNLPEYYKGIPEIDILYNVIEDNDKYYNDLINLLKKELFILSAESSGVEMLSKTLLISNDKLDIITKLRGSNTITKLNLGLIVKELLKQETPIEVTEIYSDNIIYLGIHNNNENINKIIGFLKKELRNIIPAHLELSLYFNTLIWLKLDNYNKSWNAINRANLNWNNFEKYNEGI